MDYERFHHGAAAGRAVARIEHRINHTAPIDPDALADDLEDLIRLIEADPVDYPLPGCVPAPPTTSPHGVAPEPTRATAAGRHRRPRRKLFGGWAPWRA